MRTFPPHPNLLLRASHGRFLILPAGLQAPGLQRFTAFPGGVGVTAGAPRFDAALRAAGRDGGMLAIRGFYNQWRFGDAASLPDQDLLKLLARDVRAGFLAAFYLPDEDFAGFTLTGDDGQAVPAPIGPVSGWSVKQKLVAMFEDIPDDLGTAAQAEFRAFISPGNLATMAGILVFIAGVQAIPGADAFVDGLIIALAWAQFGWAGLLAARDFVQAVAQAGQAQSDDEIKLAAKLAAAALVSLGLVVFLKKLTGKVRQSSTMKGEDEAPQPAAKKTNTNAKTEKLPIPPPKTPVELAKETQGSGNYPGVDDWKPATLKKGDIVYGGSPGQSNFYTTEQAVEQYGQSRSSMFQALQSMAHPSYGYRPGMTAYEVMEDTPVATSSALANPQLGAGGAQQFFMPNFQSSLKPLFSIPLKP